MLTLTLPRVVASVIESKSTPKPSRILTIDPARARLVDDIISINVSATAAFLDRFSTPELEHYLQHLKHVDTPRTSASRWVRPAGAPGIVAHDALS